MSKQELLKIAKPISFNTEMLKAVLGGRKSITRRLIKPQPNIDCHSNWNDECSFSDKKPEFYDTGNNNCACMFCGAGIGENGKSDINAKYQVGDILYVREQWSTNENGEYVYRTDYGTTADDTFSPFNYKWKSLVTMPKEAARIFLKVTVVRVEKVHDITDEKAIAEGFENAEAFGKSFFEIYPDSDGDSFVWVIEFERIEANDL